MLQFVRLAATSEQMLFNRCQGLPSGEAYVSEGRARAAIEDGRSRRRDRASCRAFPLRDESAGSLGR